MSAFILTVVIVLIGWLWTNSLRAREHALEVGRAACHSSRVQMLDQTVSLSSMGLGRNEAGRLVLQRVYSFEFTLDGDHRREGRVAMKGDEVKAIHLNHPDGPIVIQPNS